MQKYQIKAVKNDTLIMNSTATETNLADIVAEMSKLISREELEENPDITFSITATPV